MEASCKLNLFIFIAAFAAALCFIFWQWSLEKKYRHKLDRLKNRYKEVDGALQCPDCKGEGIYWGYDTSWPCDKCCEEGYVMAKDHDFLN